MTRVTITRIMASEERQKLLEDAETSSEISAAISGMLEGVHNVTDTEVSGRTRIASNSFVPVEVSSLHLIAGSCDKQ